MARTWYLLNRPFVVAILAGIFVAFLTHHLDERRQNQEESLAQERARISQRMNLLATLPATFETASGIMNDRFIQLLAMAKAQNTDDLESKNKAFRELKALETMYHAAEAPDGLLNLTSSVFSGKAVITTADQLEMAWTEFQVEFQKVTRKWNEDGGLENTEISSAGNFRKSAVDDMNRLARKLRKEMAREIQRGRKEENTGVGAHGSGQ